MKPSSVCFLLLSGFAGAASVERRDGSPCAAVSQSVVDATSESTGMAFLKGWYVDLCFDIF